jgi:hypothetical protein
MATKQILNLGSGGVSYDTPKILLPENVFSDVRNVRFKNNTVGTITGEELYGTIINQPNFGVFWRRPEGYYNVFIRDDYAILVDATASRLSLLGLTWDVGVITDLTSCGTLPDWPCADFTDLVAENIVNGYTSARIVESSGVTSGSGSVGDGGQYSQRKWQSTTFNGGYAIVINDGERTPKFADHTVAANAFAFTDIPGWNYNANISVSAKVIKQLGYSLVAANFVIVDTNTNAVTYSPSTVRISVQAAPGSFPQIWQPGTTTDTADEFEISTTSPILDLAELRGTMFIYSESSINTLSLNTGIARVQPYSSSFGILNTDCVIEFEGSHFVVDRNDVYTHNGSGNITSIATDFVRDYLFDNLSYSNQSKTFVKKDSHNREIWICYPKGNSVSCNEALIYNYRNKVWTVRDLPNVTYLFNTVDVEPYTEVAKRNQIVMLDGSLTVLASSEGYEMYNPDTGLFSSFESYVTKEKLNSGDLFSTHIINSMTPVFDEVPANNTIDIKVTGQNTINTPVDWDSSRSLFVFDPNAQYNQGYKVDPRTSGRFLSYDIRSNGPWRLALIGVDVVPKDRR